MSSTSIESQRQAAIVQQKTGEFFCHSGSHYTKGEVFMRRGRKQCGNCKKRIESATRKH